MLKSASALLLVSGLFRVCLCLKYPHRTRPLFVCGTLLIIINFSSTFVHCDKWSNMPPVCFVLFIFASRPSTRFVNSSMVSFFRLQLYAKMCLFSHKALLITFVKTYRVLERTCWQCFLDLFCKIISDFSRLIICIVDLLVSLFWGLEVILDFELCIFALSAIMKEFLFTL